MVMTAARLGALRVRFVNAMRSIGVAVDVGAAFDELTTRYAEAHRHYHTLSHVDACLAWLDWFYASAEHPGEVELALWFHDAVYDPGAADNERRSAELAVDWLERLGGDHEAIRRIASHIENTACHDALRGDAALVNDIDLTILGADRTEFDRFENAIRCEYAAAPDEAFAAGRRQILESFLARDEIFKVSGIRAELEATARANLFRRVGELRTAC
jgi:predicted metal-dependent HD superfamily phosphohydrolase